MNPDTMNLVIGAVLAMLAASVVLTMVRMARGPRTLDRVAALDMFVILSVAGASVYIAFFEDASNIPLLAAVALCGLVGSATAARLVERRERHR